MILICPHCKTRYHTEAANFPAAGRKVRCAKCGQVWHQMLSELGANLAELPRHPGSPEPVRAGSAIRAALRGTPGGFAEKPADERPLAEKVGLAIGWAGLIAMIALVGWVALRKDIAAMWPRSVSSYATFGVPVNANGIAISDWTYHIETAGGDRVMVVTGRLVNTSLRVLPVPSLRISLTDNDQRELYHWNYHSPQPTLGPGRSLGFMTRVSGAQPAARLQLHFASQQ